jgi:hypothetical protein
MRRAVALVLGLLVTVSLLAATGCQVDKNAAYKTAIEKALHEDALTGHEPTLDHAAEMRNVDLTGCPEDFRTAYTNHIHAWDDAAKAHQAVEELNSESDAATAAVALGKIFGTDASAWSDRDQAVVVVTRLQKAASDAIHSTWATVQQVAAKYGAQVPQ